jgi:hypothetical protein
MAAIHIDHHSRPAGVPVRAEIGPHHDVADFHVDRAHPVSGPLGLLAVSPTAAASGSVKKACGTA